MYTYIQHYTFYDLIITQARGKSGPLFHFDVHDDVRLMNDARVEKDESHPGTLFTFHSSKNTTTSTLRQFRYFYILHMINR